MLISALRYIGKAVLLGLLLAGLLIWVPRLHLLNLGTSDPQNAPALSYAYAASQAGPAVVNIYTRSFQHSTLNDTKELLPQSLGSGVIMSRRGYVLTNFHVISDADQIIVALQDGRILSAELVGADVPTDLAVLSITADNLPEIPQDPQLSPLVGDVVLAIGNPYNVGQTITQGIISATGRVGLSTMGPDSNGRQDLLQTDAAINSGNSGGALVNTRGELVGINAGAYHLGTSQEGYGISFAIPYKLAKRIMDELITHGRVKRGYVGISSVQIDSVTAKLQNDQVSQGLVIENMDNNGPAVKGGLQRGDLLLQINDKPINNVRDAMDIIAEMPPGTKAKFTILRDGKQQVHTITVEEDTRFSKANTH
ncbi:MAG: outer membrane-stress sensor serine endopeptidase DegS [Tolumonas sp.]|uniref:outer membrane-stress sensor serine endopeptidase DegS n=1 Tax=uncultured Tolumonas sp. TaxID=263765 RepID=UPI002A0A4AD6|nr:outer membrane-stress sensor serine endopeptidase DegS [uncultured Tolumonas sp.]MDD2841794.1 outer membrane-stress sensor serine endopeptidase DegS [Tolumonas sp.]